MKNSVFKSEDGRDNFRAYYNQVLSHFPFEQRYVETTFGRTFLLTAGQVSKPPVILLHGSCSNSAFWSPEITALMKDYRVYAVDIIGEAGNSEEYRPDLNSEAFALWLKEVLDGLELQKAIIIGNSLGGWMALKFATAFPDRVISLVLIAASGLAQLRQEFLPATEPTKQKKEATMDTPDILGEEKLPKEVLAFINLIFESYTPIQELPLYTDEELIQLNMPVLFLDGENDIIIDSQKSAQRLSQLIPSAEVHLLGHTGHVVTNSTEYVLPFLRKIKQI